METYHKINSIFKRDTTNKLILGDYSIPEFLYLENNIWEFTEKVDGTNIRIILTPEHKVEFNGKTNDAQMPGNLLNRLHEHFGNNTILADYFNDCHEGVCLYGEGYGGKIQKGGKYRPDSDFVLFDVKIGNWWLKREDVIDIGTKLGIDTVPVIGKGTLLQGIESVKKGLKSQWGDFEAEGIVARPEIDLFTRSGNRIITKIKGKDFKY